MFIKRMIRFISTNDILHQSTNKSLLASLRKKTGYTLLYCKKALELNENNLEKVFKVFLLYEYY
jgi:elongation factor Ts